MSDKPEALLLAGQLESGEPVTGSAAAVLRRLHEVNQELLEALEELCSCPQWVDEATVPKAGIETAPQQVVVNLSVALVRLRKARAVIAKATGEQV